MGIRTIGIMALLLATTGGVWALQFANLGNTAAPPAVPTANDPVAINFVISQCTPETGVAGTAAGIQVPAADPNTLAFADTLVASISMSPVNLAEVIAPEVIPEAIPETIPPVVATPVATPAQPPISTTPPPVPEVAAVATPEIVDIPQTVTTPVPIPRPRPVFSKPAPVQPKRIDSPSIIYLN